MSKIVTVAAAKGGVGKTTIACELAYLLDAPLIDLDWDRGSATGSAWGYRVRDRVGAPLLDAFERGRTPRLLRSKRKPDLAPSHPDLEANQPPPGDVADASVLGPILSLSYPAGRETEELNIPGWTPQTTLFYAVQNICRPPGVPSGIGIALVGLGCERMRACPLGTPRITSPS